MELLIHITSWIFLLLLSLIPFLFLQSSLKRNSLRFKFWIYFIFTLIVGSVIIFSFAYYVHLSNDFLLTHYGYNDDGLTISERFIDVSTNNNEVVENLLISQSGIGWPLKAVFGIIFYMPYALIAYLFYLIYSKNRSKINSL